jgi:hypothetical protein
MARRVRAVYGGRMTGRVWFDGAAWCRLTVVDGQSVGGQAPTREEAEEALLAAEDGHEGRPRLRIVR